MRYLTQFCIILIVSFIGEILNRLIPLPVPASIYGLVLMLICLKTRLIPLRAVRETGSFLLEIMPLLFLPAAAGLIGSWDIAKPVLLPYIVIIVVSTFAVMLAAGHAAQTVIRLERRKAEK